MLPEKDSIYGRIANFVITTVASFLLVVFSFGLSSSDTNKREDRSDIENLQREKASIDYVNEKISDYSKIDDARESGTQAMFRIVIKNQDEMRTDLKKLLTNKD